jgi:hypothetical protein
MSLGFMSGSVRADIGASKPLSAADDLLQFKAGSHIMGFKPDKVYLVNTAGFLSVEFLGANTVSPNAVIVEANQTKNDAAITSSRGNKLVNLQRVEYPNLWDGITLRYDAANEGISESTYFIEPGAEVAEIQLRYNTDTELLKDGSLKIKLPTQQGYITESSPVAWQILNGKKQFVQVAYEIKDGVVGFTVKDYDKYHELIIDPTYQWHTFQGSGSTDEGYGIAVDGSGNVYVAGYSHVTWGNPLHPHSGSHNTVVLKLDSSGVYQWHTFYPGNYHENHNIAVDGNGNVYVSSGTDSSWGTPLYPYAGGYGSNITILKLNSSGAYQWHTFYPGNYGENHHIAVDGSGNVYVAGSSQGSYSWGTPLHAHSAPVNGVLDIQILKLNSSGAYQWHTYYGDSSSSDYSTGICVDGSGNVYVSAVSSVNWGNPVNAHIGDKDIVVLKLNSSGALQWHTFQGSGYSDTSSGIAVDGQENVYVSGNSVRNWGSPIYPYGNNGNLVVLKLDPSGHYLWNTFAGDWTSTTSYGLAVDSNGAVYVTGYSYGSWGTPVHAYTGGSADLMVLKLNSSGMYLWHTYYGSTYIDNGRSITLDGNGSIYVTGKSGEEWGSPVHNYVGGYDVMVLKLGQPAVSTSKFPWAMFLPVLTKER